MKIILTNKVATLEEKIEKEFLEKLSSNKVAPTSANVVPSQAVQQISDVII